VASFFERFADRTKRLAHAWNVFRDEDDFQNAGYIPQFGSNYGGYTPARRRLNGSTERSIVAAVYMRLGIDAAAIDIRHVRLDEEGRYQLDMPSGLNNCLTVEANIDQAPRAFKQDGVMTMCDKGAIAIVPTETATNPSLSGVFDIRSLRIGEVVAWHPRHVRVRLWNDWEGRHEEVTVPKEYVAIVENPLYQVMNEPNSTLQRLIRKLNILDAVDEASSSGKLDIIIQLPYTVKSESRKEQATERITSVEGQLRGSKYGIAYIDATEKITQLNRPAENNLLNQIEYLTKMLYGQLGLTEEVFTGAADEATMLNYFNRTIEPIVAAIVEAMRRTFLTKTARSQRQDILFFRDPFKLVTMNNFADLADKLVRNEIVTSNELRGVIGLKPHPDPKADKLVNSNMPQPVESTPPTTQTEA